MKREVVSEQTTHTKEPQRKEQKGEAVCEKDYEKTARGEMTPKGQKWEAGSDQVWLPTEEQIRTQSFLTIRLLSVPAVSLVWG